MRQLTTTPSPPRVADLCRWLPRSRLENDSGEPRRSPRQQTSNGTFSVAVQPSTTYNLKVEQFNTTETESWPRDGRPNIHAIDRGAVGATDVSLGDYQLPETFDLNGTVVDRDGNPIENATLTVALFASGALI